VRNFESSGKQGQLTSAVLAATSSFIFLTMAASGAVPISLHTASYTATASARKAGPSASVPSGGGQMLTRLL